MHEFVVIVVCNTHFEFCCDMLKFIFLNISFFFILEFDSWDVE